MRIAVCFSGHLRNFLNNELQELKINERLLLDAGHEVDYFFSVWDTYNTSTAHYNVINHTAVVFLEEALKDLNVKGLEIENFEDLKNNFYLKNIHPTIQPELSNIISADGILHSTPMFYKLYKANRLKKAYESKFDFQYDVVIRYRANIKLLDPLDVAHVESDTMYSAGHGNPSGRGLGYTHESLMTQDMFFYGSSPIIDIVCDLYPNLSRVIASHGSTGPERILYDWCFLENNLKHKVSPIKFTYTR